MKAPRPKAKAKRTAKSSLVASKAPEMIVLESTTRGGRNFRGSPTPRARMNLRNSEKFIYTAPIGERFPGRKGMSKAVSDKISEQDKKLGSYSLARLATPLLNEKRNLKQNNLSRDHILADSRIRWLLNQTANRLEQHEPNQAQVKALVRFFTSICGPKDGPVQAQKFLEACPPAEVLAGLKQAEIENIRQNRSTIINDACEGIRNLRYGHADINTAITNQFDPITIDGRLDRRTMEVRDAVYGLAYRGLITFDSAFISLAVTKDRSTLQDVTSTALRRVNMQTATGTRTSIDPFARAADIKSPFFYEAPERPSPDSTAIAPLADFHYGSREPAAASSLISRRRKAPTPSESAMTDIDSPNKRSKLSGPGLSMMEE